MSESWEYEAEAYYEELYSEFFDRAVEEYTADLLQIYYRAHPDIAQPALKALGEARSLLSISPSAAHVFASVATEVGLKSALLKPVVHGLVHNEAAAEVVADLTLRQYRFDRFQQLLLIVLAKYGGVDLTTFQRPSGSRPLWNEILSLQKCRDRIVHQAKFMDVEGASEAIAVAAAVLEIALPKVLAIYERGRNDFR